MNSVSEFVLIAGGSAATFAAQAVLSWMKSRGEVHRVDRDAELRLDEQRNDLTSELLNLARQDITQLREEVSQLRPLQNRVAHLEEALDHVHALLNANGPEECRAAHNRARAFLKRMRPEVGDLRNAVQVAESAREVAKRIEGGIR